MAHDFSGQLRRLRKRRGLSCKLLGELCGLSKNTIGLYERGERRPTVEALVAIADFFDITVDELLGRGGIAAK